LLSAPCRLSPTYNSERNQQKLQQRDRSPRPERHLCFQVRSCHVHTS
jgi:hypothetical protein